MLIFTYCMTVWYLMYSFWGCIYVLLITTHVRETNRGWEATPLSRWLGSHVWLGSQPPWKMAGKPKDGWETIHGWLGSRPCLLGLPSNLVAFCFSCGHSDSSAGFLRLARSKVFSDSTSFGSGVLGPSLGFGGALSGWVQFWILKRFNFDCISSWS